MKHRYRMFLRGNTYYAHDAKTNKQTSLRTPNKRKAGRLLLAKNEADAHPHPQTSRVERRHLRRGGGRRRAGGTPSQAQQAAGTCGTVSTPRRST